MTSQFYFRKSDCDSGVELMTSLPVLGCVLSMRSVSLASVSRCMESCELANGEGESSRDVAALSALFSLTDNRVTVSSGAADTLPIHRANELFIHLLFTTQLYGSNDRNA